jgi:hypothetical protein
MNRSDKAEIVRALRKEGAHYNEIASVLGCSSSTVGDLLWDPDGSKARARKDSYRGACIDCGAPTNGADGPGKASPRCNPCATKHRTFWTRERVVTAIQEWAERYGAPPTSVDWNPWMLYSDDGGLTMARYRVNAPPHTTVVMRVFGSWNNAIKAAGFEPRRVGSRGPDRGKRRTAA